MGQPKRSPWGKVQNAVQFAEMEDCWRISTSSHGGIKLSPKMNKEIPKLFRRSGGWYEEDCEAAIPLHFLKKQPDAIPVLKNYFWRNYEQFFNCSIPEEESQTKRIDMHEEKNKNNWCVISCSPHDKELLRVICTLGGSYNHGVPRRYFLVPVQEYQSRDKVLSFVIDLRKHAEI